MSNVSMTGLRVYSDIFRLENINQTVGVAFAKNLIIDHLRDVFSQDRFYKYRSDMFGYPLVGDLTDETSDIDEEDTTRIFIGSLNKYEISFVPGIFVSSKSLRYEPISFNQNLENILYQQEYALTYDPENATRADGYVASVYKTPSHKEFVGAWSQQIEVRVVTQSPNDMEELADICAVTLQGHRRLALQQEGVFIKSISASGESSRKYSNDNLYVTNITIDARTEWKIHIPINNLFERIALYVILDDQGGDSLDGLVINNRITL